MAQRLKVLFVFLEELVEPQQPALVLTNDLSFRGELVPSSGS